MDRSMRYACRHVEFQPHDSHQCSAAMLWHLDKQNRRPMPCHIDSLIEYVACFQAVARNIRDVAFQDGR